MEMKREILKYSAICIIVILYGLFVYPGVYHYDKYNQKPMRVNRITGTTQIFYPDGWETISKQDKNKPKNNDSVLPTNNKESNSQDTVKTSVDFSKYLPGQSKSDEVVNQAKLDECINEIKKINPDKLIRIDDFLSCEEQAKQ